MIKVFTNDERGAVTVDWVALTAGILLVGIMVVYAVMNQSAGYLMEEFAVLNDQYEKDAISVFALGAEIDINQ